MCRQSAKFVPNRSLIDVLASQSQEAVPPSEPSTPQRPTRRAEPNPIRDGYASDAQNTPVASRQATQVEPSQWNDVINSGGAIVPRPNNHGALWTAQEDQTLRRLYSADRRPVHTIASVIGRTATAIELRLKLLGLIPIPEAPPGTPPNPNPNFDGYAPWPRNHIEILRRDINRGTDAVARSIGRDPKAVYTRAQILGLLPIRYYGTRSY